MELAGIGWSALGLLAPQIVALLAAPPLLERKDAGGEFPSQRDREGMAKLRMYNTVFNA